MRKIEESSWLQLNGYWWCGKAWFLHYIEKRWPEEKAQPLCFGIAYHSAIEQFLRREYLDVKPMGRSARGEDRWAVAVANLCTRFDYVYTFGKDAGPDPDIWLPVGQNLLLNFATEVFKHNIEIVEIEKWCKKPFGEITISGKIDCVARIDGKTTLIDWKTANKPYTEKKVRTDGQLTLYQWLYPEPVDGLAFVIGDKETGKIHWYETERTQKQVDRLLRSIETTLEEMEMLEEFKGVHNWKCQYCDLTPEHCRGEGDW